MDRGDLQYEEGYNGLERRRYKRLPLNTNIEYREVNLGKNFQSDTIQNANIGGGGIYIPVADPLPVGSMMELKLDLPGLEDSVRMIAKVVWSNTSEDPIGMGLEFYKIKSEVRDHIVRNARRGSWIQPQLKDPDRGSAAI